MSDSDGMEEPYYQFTISNICENDWASYQINIETIEASTEETPKYLPERYIKANLSVGEDSKVTTKLTSDLNVTPTIEEAVRAYKLLVAKLAPGASVTYDLRLWMDEGVTMENTDAMNATYESKISVVFSYMEPPVYLVDKIKEQASKDENVCGDNGIVEVKHDDATIADIDYHTFDEKLNNETVKSNLKMTEYRYCGEDPNNYVTFNNETAGWRIIGLVNTPEGQRIKIIRATPLYLNLSWDNKPSGTGSSNSSYGSNDWSDSRLQELLNKGGAYYNRTSGTCYKGSSNASTSCNFGDSSETPGLTAEAKNMIDTITWNLGGTASYSSASNGLTKHFYNYERGIIVYTNSSLTNPRPTLWQGEVGLMYPSDYGYATGGGSTYNRGACLSKELYNWSSGTYRSNCAHTDWLLNKSSYQWTLSPYSSASNYAFYVHTAGIVYSNYYVNSAYAVAPVLYLKSDVQIGEGSGLDTNPYTLEQG